MGHSEDWVHMPQLVAKTFVVSTSEARRCINQGGVSLDGRKMLDFDLPREWVDGKELRLGRRRSAVVRLEED